MTQLKTIRIGTRGSALALYQANHVKDALEQSAKTQGISCAFEIVDIKTTGDKVLDRRLSEIGGKALFTKEIDIALMDNHVDIGAHSMKDCETFLSPAFHLGAILEREDPRDVLVSQNNVGLQDLPEGATLGTCSLRRTSQILHLRSDLKPVLFRGNVPTRLQKVADGEAVSSLFALAGLKRLELAHHACQILSTQEMTPCAGQGAIGVVCLKSDSALKDFLHTINHPTSYDTVTLERFFLESIDGHCGTPIGVLVESHNQGYDLTACVATVDGKHLWREHLTLSQEAIRPEITRLGKEMKQWLKTHNL
jgi:hydroxymethylbilane synthase